MKAELQTLKSMLSKLRWNRMKHPVLVRLGNQFCNQRRAAVTQWRWGQGGPDKTMYVFVSETEQTRDLGRKVKVIQEA